MKQTRLVLLFLLLLALPALACNAVTDALDGDEPEQGLLATDAVSEAPAGQDSADSGEVAEPAGPESLDLETLASGLKDVNSYRVSIEIRAEGPDGSGGTETVVMTMENATVVDPPASQSDITIAGIENDLGLNTLQFITVGDTAYSTIPGIGCISGSAGSLGDQVAANPFADIFDSNDIIGDVQGAQRQLPDENINGVESYHFVFDESAIQDPDNTIEQVDGHIYIAKEEGYVVRLVMDGTGRIDLMGTGQEEAGMIHLEANTRDVNQSIDIQPPANCDTFNLDEIEIPDFDFSGDATDAPYPVFADNQELFVLDDILSYQTTASFDEVVAFYQAEMPAAGFEPLADGTVLTNDAAVMQYSQGGQNYFVTISVDGDTVYVQVVPE